MSNRRVRKARKQQQSLFPIEIPLPVRSPPCTYKQGDGPALAPLGILLKNDGTGYIVDRSPLPVKPPNDDPDVLMLQMHYLVRWTDLPAACVAVPARNILDYVSPRNLEDFEYELALERQREEEEKEKAEEAKKAAGRKSIPATPGTPSSLGPKKRGRLTKAEMLSSRQAKKASEEALNVPLPPASLPPATSPSGPSLSTPQKKLRVTKDVISDSEARDSLDDDNAILQQLNNDVGLMDTELEEIAENEQDSDLPAIAIDPVPPTAPQIHNSLPSRPSAAPAPSAPQPISTARTIFQLPPKPTATPKPFIQTTLTASSFTPAGRSSGQRPRSPIPELKLAAADPVENKGPVKSPRKRKASEPEPEPAEGQVWEVKRLEADKIIEINGKRERYFKVRWVGDWPPDQNPTWEPEENLPRVLVKRYLKKKGKAAMSDVEEVNLVPIPSSAQPKKYSSLAEALEGEIEEIDRGGYPPEHHMNGEDDGEEERLVVAEDDDEDVGNANNSSPQPSQRNKMESLDFARARGQALGYASFKGNGNGIDMGNNGTGLHHHQQEHESPVNHF